MILIMFMCAGQKNKTEVVKNMESRARMMNLNSHSIALSKGTWIRVAHFLSYALKIMLEHSSCSCF